MTIPTNRPPAAGRATLVGLVAICLWSSMTALTTAAEAIPPLELAAITFAVGGSLSLGLTILRGSVANLKQHPAVWALGIAGYFGDFVLFFWALKLAPAAQASLVSYLWPLFTVLLSTFLLNEQIRPRHIGGAALGFAGIVVLMADQGLTLAFSPRFLLGYALALGSALSWAGYSVLFRRFAAVPSDTVAVFCLGTAALAALFHAALEDTVIPREASQIAALLAIGIGPAGLAFICWDIGIKKGDLRALGIVSYVIPLASTLLLIASGRASPTPLLYLACLMVSGAAALATVPNRRQRV